MHNVQRVRQDFNGAAQAYDREAGLQWRVAEALMRTVSPLLGEQARVLDVGAGTGFLPQLAAGRAWRWVLVDIAQDMLAQARAKELVLEGCVVADIHALPLGAAVFDAVVSSLAFQWVNDPVGVLEQLRAVMKPQGVLAFATFGPETLKELREAFAYADPQQVRVNQFSAAEEWREALASAGFGEVRCEIVPYVETYPSLQGLVGHLRAIGATHKEAGRSKHLAGQQRFVRAEAYYQERFAVPEGVMASWEVVQVVARVS